MKGKKFMRKEFLLNIPLIEKTFVFFINFDMTQFNIGGEIGCYSELCEECKNHEVLVVGGDLFLGFLVLSFNIL
jgi:hypothetical protein